jgi:lysine-specific metallo-endopeptidase family protein
MMLGPIQHVNELLTVKFVEAKGPKIEHLQRLNRALALARQATEAAVNHLVRPPSPDPLYNSIRDEFFKGIGGLFNKAKILTTLALTADGLSKQINISDVAGRGATLEGFPEGYTAITRGVAKSIHLEFMLLGIWSEPAIARIIIHEATHKFAKTEDHAYMSDEAKWAGMTPPQSIQNADSYAYAALSFYARRIVTMRTFISTGGMPVPDIKVIVERGKRPELPGASAAHAKAAS